MCFPFRKVRKYQFDSSFLLDLIFSLLYMQTHLRAQQGQRKSCKLPDLCLVWKLNLAALLTQLHREIKLLRSSTLLSGSCILNIRDSKHCTRGLRAGVHIASVTQAPEISLALVMLCTWLILARKNELWICFSASEFSENLLRWYQHGRNLYIHRQTCQINFSHFFVFFLCFVFVGTQLLIICQKSSVAIINKFIEYFNSQ